MSDIDVLYNARLWQRMQLQPTVETCACRPGLTKDELEAIRYFAYIRPHNEAMTKRYVATLCSLLARHGGGE